MRWQRTLPRLFLASVLASASIHAVPGSADTDEASSSKLAPLLIPPSPDALAPFVIGIVEGSILGGVHTAALCPGGGHCVLNAGGGLGARMEWRFPKRLSTGFGVELLLIDGSALYEITTMQTLRYTLRLLGQRERRLHPLLDASIGAGLLGDSFKVDTIGGFIDLRGGFEVELNPQLAVDFGFGVRALTFRPYRTALDGVERAAIFGPDIVLAFHLGFVVMPRTTKPRIMQQRRGAPEHLQPGGGRSGDFSGEWISERSLP